jgi:hypothetical protein
VDVLHIFHLLDLHANGSLFQAYVTNQPQRSGFISLHGLLGRRPHEFSDRVLCQQREDCDETIVDSEVEMFHIVILRCIHSFRHYVFGIYFVPDVLSSIPEMHQLNLFVNEEIAEVLDYFAMLKIVRILTFIQYTKRMFAVSDASIARMLLILIFSSSM